MLSPTEKWGTKLEYTEFRTFLRKDGYIRIGPELYMRVVQNRNSSEKYYKRIMEYAPKSGVVRMSRLTEKQYNSIHYVTGNKDYQETIVGANSLVVIQ